MSRKLFECCLLLCVSLFVFAQEAPTPNPTPAPTPAPRPVVEPPNAIKKIVAGTLVTAKGKKVKGSDALAGKKLIGLYFSAHWCGPCRAFTPELVKFRDKCVQKGLPFEIVFVSSDNTEADMFKYMKETNMKWYAVPFESKLQKEIDKIFNVGGIPTLIVLNGKGKVITKAARMDVANKGIKAYDHWKALNNNSKDPEKNAKKEDKKIRN